MLEGKKRSDVPDLEDVRRGKVDVGDLLISTNSGAAEAVNAGPSK